MELGTAIALAEKEGGRAMEARSDVNAGKDGYTVKLVEHGKLRLIWIDGSGQFVAGNTELADGSAWPAPRPN